MAHQCTDCGATFEDGSTEMLSGCPQCGGNTFQYLPSGVDPSERAPPDADPPDRSPPGDSITRTVGNAATSVRDFVSGGSEPAGESDTGSDPLSPWPGETDSADGQGPVTTQNEADGTVTTQNRREESVSQGKSTTHEDDAQRSARSSVVSSSELPVDTQRDDEPTQTEPADQDEQPPTQTKSESDHESEPDDSERPDLSELREELNDQFESIRIVEPGQYELNLMELYERDEYIIALQEDGRYQIQVPGSWKD